MSKNDKNKHKGKVGGISGFGVTALALMLLIKPSSILGLGLVGAFAFLVGKVTAIMSSGLDTTTHNRQDKIQREVEDLNKNGTGDENADAVISKGQEMLRQIRAANNAIPDQTLSQQMYELERLCVQIFKTVAEKPGKASQIRKFMNYYLPTTLKMLNSYRTMQERGVSRSDMLEARNALIHGMNMILTACQKQLDNLFKDEMLDVSTDIDVLEQMLKRDGFVDGPLSGIEVPQEQPVQAQPAQAQHAPEVVNDRPILHQPRTAASAQLGTQPRPTLMVDEDGDGVDDFQSFYQRR